jgi:hypothetical protein
MTAAHFAEITLSRMTAAHAAIFGPRLSVELCGIRVKEIVIKQIT